MLRVLDQTREETIPVTNTKTTQTAAIEYILRLFSFCPSSVDGWVTYRTGTPITAIKEEKRRAFTKKKLTACMIQWLKVHISILYSHKKAFFGKNLHSLSEL